MEWFSFLREKFNPSPVPSFQATFEFIPDKQDYEKNKQPGG
jgi:hypothetical protein